MQTVSQRMALLRQRMALRGLDACVVVTDDFHGSEYVGDHFKTREYLSGFTGSAGTLVVLPDQAALWTDGRYFLQAERQLAGSGIDLMRAGQPGVPKLSDFLAERLPEDGVLAFDGRTVSTRLYRTLTDALAPKHIRLDGSRDLADEVWPDRPPLSAQPLWPLESDVSRREKLTLLRARMVEKDAAHLLLTDLTDIAWTLGLRGGDVECTPVFLSFLLLNETDAVLFVQSQSVSPAIADALVTDGVTLRPYEDIYDHLSSLPPDDRVLLDSATANSHITQSLAPRQIIDAPSPATALKAVKSPGEQDGFRRAHLLDGVALTRFLYRLKTAPAGLTELSAAALLHDLRAESEDFLQDSFSTIVAYGPHGAVVHYEPTAETDVPLEARGLLLCDSGGHYRGGTTDVTRTVALGPVSDEAPPVHPGAAGPHPPGYGPLPPGRVRRKPGRAGPPAPVAAGSGLRPRHGSRRGLRPQRPRRASLHPLAHRGKHAPPRLRAGHGRLRRAGLLRGRPVRHPPREPAAGAARRRPLPPL